MSLRHLFRFTLPALGLATALTAALPTAMAQGTSPDHRGSGDFVQRAVHACAACHGPEGRSTKALAPSLAGQPREYTIRQLKDFRDQSRSETDIQAYMWGISALLTDEQIELLADYYAAQTPARGRSVDPKLEARGKALYYEGIPGRSVRACASCHGQDAEGASGFPRLAGLHRDYLVKQLTAFRTPLRPHGVVMKNETRALDAQEMRAVAAYLQSR